MNVPDIEPAFEIRYMMHTDYAEAAAIDRVSFSVPWDWRAFSDALASRNTMGIVIRAASTGTRPIAYILYDLQPESIDILRMAVDPTFRRQRLGSALIWKMHGKLSAQGKRQTLTITAPDDCLEGHLFLRALAFRCVSVVGHSEGPDDYVFRYRLGDQSLERVGDECGEGQGK